MAGTSPEDIRRVCVMVPTLTLLVFGLSQVPVIELLPWYIAAYLVIGACIFGSTTQVPSLRQAVAFLLPGALLVGVAFLDLGLWCGGWLLGLPAWGLMLSSWTPESPLPAVQVLKFRRLLAFGVIAFAIPTPEGSWSSPWIYASGAATAGLMIVFCAGGIPRRSRRLKLNNGAVV